MSNKKVEAIVNLVVGELCTGKEANDLMNKYFVNIGQELADKLPVTNFEVNRNEMCGSQLSSFDELTRDELFKILKENSLSKVIRFR